MILNKKPLAISEVKEYVKDSEGKEVLINYLKKFGKVSKSDIKKIEEKIQSIDNLKIKDKDIVKIIDFLPKDKEDVNKLFVENNLNDEEAKALLEIVKDY